jgi:hypothetical protein
LETIQQLRHKAVGGLKNQKCIAEVLHCIRIRRLPKLIAYAIGRCGFLLPLLMIMMVTMKNLKVVW